MHSRRAAVGGTFATITTIYYISCARKESSNCHLRAPARLQLRFQAKISPQQLDVMRKVGRRVFWAPAATYLVQACQAVTASAGDVERPRME